MPPNDRIMDIEEKYFPGSFGNGLKKLDGQFTIPKLHATNIFANGIHASDEILIEFIVQEMRYSQVRSHSFIHILPFVLPFLKL